MHPPNLSPSSIEHAADRLVESIVEHVPEALREPLHTPRARRLGRIAWRLALIAYFIFGIFILVLRYWVMPEVASFRPDIERALSTTLHRTVRLGELEGYWAGLRPAIRLGDLTILDENQETALHLDRVDAHLAWDSFLARRTYLTRFVRLEVHAPDLHIRRNSEGKLFIAGIELTPSTESDDGFVDWLIAQDRILIHGANITWQDEQRAAPELRIGNVNIRMENSGRRHRFGLTTDQMQPLAGALDLRGELHGRSLADLANWAGKLYLAFDAADIEKIRPWIDLPPQLHQGTGNLRAWVEVAEQSLNNLTLDMQLRNLQGQLQTDLPAFSLTQLEGRVKVDRHKQTLAFNTENLSLVTRDGRQLRPVTMDARLDQGIGDATSGEATLNSLDIGVLTSLASHLPLPEEVRSPLNDFSPEGQISDLRLTWRSRQGTLERWNISSRFNALSLAAHGELPGMRNISGRILGDQDKGRLNIETRRAELILPTIFPQPNLPFDKVDAVVEWTKAAKAADSPLVNLRRLNFENVHVAGSANGSWHPSANSRTGIIDLTARLSRAQAQHVWRYLPLVISKDARDWVQDSVRDGHSTDTTLALRGNLDDFPFNTPTQGLFEVKGKIHGGHLNYGKNWPDIEHIEGDLLFRGAQMVITTNSAKTLDAALTNVRAEIPNLGADNPLLAITGQAHATTGEFLRFVESSPVTAMLEHATTPMQATGNGQLDLALKLPLNNLASSEVNGKLRVENASLQIDPAIPVITQINGQLGFTENSLSAKNLHGQFLGGPITADISTDKKMVALALDGEVRVASLQDVPYLRQLALLNHLSGSSKWQGLLRVGALPLELSVSSSLQGLSSSLPPPFNKSASDSAPLRFERKPVANLPSQANASAGKPTTKSGKQPPTTESWELTLGKQIRGQWLRPLNAASEPAQPPRGGIAIGRAPLKLGEHDLLVSIDLPDLDIAFWNKLRSQSGTVGEPPDPTQPIRLPPLSLDIHADRMQIAGRAFADVRITGRRTGDSLGSGTTQIEIRSPAIAGNLNYREVESGVLSGTLQRVMLSEAAGERNIATGNSTGNSAGSVADAPPDTTFHTLPKIDVVIEQLGYKRHNLGRLTLNAANRSPQLWEAQLGLRNPDAELEGHWRWSARAGEAGEAGSAMTQSEFRLNVNNLEGFMGRIDYPGTLRQGKASAEGKLSWQGPPMSPHYPSLSGAFSLDAHDGQFNKLEPGVGRLLGILSLQSLPRRITLDFRDIFSAGFAFDRIAGNFTVKQGIMSTDNLDVRGPAAKVLMRGRIDLANETQDLTVRVQPALGESLAVGAMIANPVAGAVVWATQKLLSDPLDQVFAYDYALTGTWSDPKVEKLSSASKSAGSPP